MGSDESNRTVVHGAPLSLSIRFGFIARLKCFDEDRNLPDHKPRKLSMLRLDFRAAPLAKKSALIQHELHYRAGYAEAQDSGEVPGQSPPARAMSQECGYNLPDDCLRRSN